MKILFILENYHPSIGGVETLFKYLTENLSTEGHHVTVLTNKNHKSIPIKQIHGNLTVIRVPFINRFIFTVLAWIPAIYYATKADLIHTTSYNAGIPAFIAGKLTRTKTIITFHEVWGQLWSTLPYLSTFSSIIFKAYESILLKLPFNKFIAVSEYTKRSLIKHGIHESKISRIYNGLDYQKLEAAKGSYQMAPPDTFTFTYFGRLGSSKGIDLILQAVEILQKQHSDFLVKLIIPRTPSSFFNTVIEQIKQAKISKSIELKHELNYKELVQNILSSDTILVPSYSEGFGFSAAEASALGIPIISSGQGSLPEVTWGKVIVMSEMNSYSLVQSMEQALSKNWIVKDQQIHTLSDSLSNHIHLYNNMIKT